MKQTKKKTNNGITLVALVVTIIILLILAGITINALTDNGLFGKTKEAKEKYSRAEAMEKIQLEVLASYDNNGYLDLGKLTDNITKNIDGATIEGSEFPITVTVDGEKFIVNESGKVSYSGKGTGDSEGDKIGKLANQVLNIDPSEEEKWKKSPYVNYNGIKCRVLYNDEEHGLQIVSVEGVGEISIGSGDAETNASDFSYSGSLTLTEEQKKKCASYNSYIYRYRRMVKTYMDGQGVAKDARGLQSNPVLENGMFQTAKVEYRDYSEWPDSEVYKYGFSKKLIFQVENFDKMDDIKQARSIELEMALNYDDDQFVENLSCGGSSTHTDWGVCEVSVGGQWGTMTLSLIDLTSEGKFSANGNASGKLRPVFLISEKAKILKGQGTEDNPFQIGL